MSHTAGLLILIFWLIPNPLSTVPSYTTHTHTHTHAHRQTSCPFLLNMLYPQPSKMSRMKLNELSSLQKFHGQQWAKSDLKPPSI